MTPVLRAFVVASAAAALAAPLVAPTHASPASDWADVHGQANYEQSFDGGSRPFEWSSVETPYTPPPAARPRRVEYYDPSMVHMTGQGDVRVGVSQQCSDVPTTSPVDSGCSSGYARFSAGRVEMDLAERAAGRSEYRVEMRVTLPHDVPPGARFALWTRSSSGLDCGWFEIDLVETYGRHESHPVEVRQGDVHGYDPATGDWSSMTRHDGRNKETDNCTSPLQHSLHRKVAQGTPVQLATELRAGQVSYFVDGVKVWTVPACPSGRTACAQALASSLKLVADVEVLNSHVTNGYLRTGEFHTAYMSIHDVAYCDLPAVEGSSCRATTSEVSFVSDEASGRSLLVRHSGPAGHQLLGSVQTVPGGGFSASALLPPVGQGGVTAPDTVAAEGWFAVYGRRGDGRVVGTTSSVPANQMARGSQFQPWSTVGTLAVDSDVSAVAVPTASGDVVALYARVGDRVYGSGQSTPGGSFSTWAPIGSGGAGVTGNPVAIVTADKRIAIYARTASGTVAGVAQTVPLGGFGTWTPIGAGSPTLAADPAVVVTDGGTLAVYARSAGGHLLGTSQSAPGSDFGPWTRIGALTQVVGSPTAVLDRDNRIVLAVRHADGLVRWNRQTSAGGVFSDGWGAVAASVLGDPELALTPYAGGWVAMYARSSDNYAFLGTAETSQGAAFGAWQLMP
jgi:hypothetical protein